MARLLHLLSVPLPFHGDYIGLQRNPKLQKLKGGEEGPVLMAETVKKVNRGNGKVQPCMGSPLACSSTAWASSWIVMQLLC